MYVFIVLIVVWRTYEMLYDNAWLQCNVTMADIFWQQQTKFLEHLAHTHIFLNVNKFKYQCIDILP
jgi:hypothetical protein